MILKISHEGPLDIKLIRTSAFDNDEMSIMQCYNYYDVELSSKQFITLDLFD